MKKRNKRKRRKERKKTCKKKKEKRREEEQKKNKQERKRKRERRKKNKKENVKEKEGKNKRKEKKILCDLLGYQRKPIRSRETAQCIKAKKKRSLEETAEQHGSRGRQIDQLHCAIWLRRQRRERGYQITPHSLTLSRFFSFFFSSSFSPFFSSPPTKPRQSSHR